VDELLAILPASGVVADRKFVHSNHLYSVAALTDNSGSVVERYRYDAYGQRTVLAADGTTVRTSSTHGNQIGFTGRYQDKETNLWYFRARYYSTTLGRFAGRDPLGYMDGMSLYSGYLVPNRLDPTGNGTYTQTEMTPSNDAPGGAPRENGKDIIADITVTIDTTDTCSNSIPAASPSSSSLMCSCTGEVTFTVTLVWKGRFADAVGDDANQTTQRGRGFGDGSGGVIPVTSANPDPADPAHKGKTYTAKGPLGTLKCSGEKKTLSNILFSSTNRSFYTVTVDAEVESCGKVTKKDDNLTSSSFASPWLPPVKKNP
jgi:RHS repeat-associated protein